MSKSFVSVFLLAATLLGFTGSASADDNVAAAESRMQAPTTGANAVPDGDTADDLLTNNLLRAYAGSKSRWSMSNNINFDGGPVSNPTGLGRPNIQNASGNSVETDLNDQLAVKYNFNAVDSLLVGFGLRKIAPFVASGPDASWYASGGKDVDMYDPSLTYQKIFRMGPVQAVGQWQFIEFTRQDIVSSDVANGGNNLAQQFSYDQENIYEVPGTHWSIGGSFGVGGNTPTDATQEWSELQVWLTPYAEYAFTEKINFRTVLNEWYYEAYRISGQVRDTVTQSVGVGFSVSRDLYVFPNVQFLPDNIRADISNVGITTTLNLF